MSQESETPISSQPVESFSWSDAWVRALTRPSVTTFERLLQDPNVTTQRAYLWVAVSALVAYLISLPLSLAFSEASREGMIVELVGSLALCGICGAVLVPLLSVLGLVINAGLTHLFARALGGTGTYTELAYAYATYQAPLSLITGVLSAIPIVGYLGYAIGIYVIVLNIVAVRAVHRFGPGKAFACAVLIPMALIAVIACLLIGILLLVGPAVGNVFSTIVEELGTPVP